MTKMEHYEVRTVLDASAGEAFAYLDDPKRLSSHMSKSSWMMAGSKMEIQMETKGGKAVGSEIVLSGQMMGIPLYVRETITKRVPSESKVWQTVGPQKMLILNHYKMGFELTPKGDKTSLRVFIDYPLPATGLGRLLGLLSARVYAKWCTEMMAKDAEAYFIRQK